MKKRLLSLAIAICMVAAMLPTFVVSASALEVGEARSYYFYRTTTINEDLASNATLETITTYNTDEGRYWKYDASKNMTAGVEQDSTLKMGNLYGQTRSGQYLALDIDVPENGKYKVEYKYKKSSGGQGEVYIIPGGTEFKPGSTKLSNQAEVIAAGTLIASVDYSSSTGNENGTAEPNDVVELEAGENVLLFVVKGTGEHTTGTGHASYYTYPTSLTLTLTAKASTEDEDFVNEFGEGTYTTDTTKAFTPPAEGKATTTVNTYTAVIGGTNSTATKRTVNLGEKFSITADEVDGNGNIFRYWALGLSGNKKVLTRSTTLEFMPTVEAKHVVAVYEPENGATVSDESFYNANGQLLTDVSITDAGEMPPLPSMAGYGTASKWVQYGTNKEFEAGEEAPTENKMFVAKYEEPTETFEIDVVDGLGEGSYTYGDEVTCVANVPENKVFKCWTKTPEGSETAKIISLDSTYTFNAWEACTLTAVFADKTPEFTGNKFSIILREMTETVGGNTAYMAEFVGLGDAVEKGIMFGTKRVAMTTDAAQFTAVNDTSASDVTGYAILDDGTVIYDK